MTTANRILKALALTCLLACGSALLPGCGGNGATYQATGTTLGKELQDLQASYDQGIITKKEYEYSRKRLIKKHTQ
ncbi:MAG: hypothetical protein AB9869_06145 [Verrucomicrobiia bacterium]